MFENGGKGIGQKGKDNGVLIVVAVKERRVRIEVGYDLEQCITDGFAGETIRNTMTPDSGTASTAPACSPASTRIDQSDRAGPRRHPPGRAAAAPRRVGRSAADSVLAHRLRHHHHHRARQQRPAQAAAAIGAAGWSGWTSGVGPFGGGGSAEASAASAAAAVAAAEASVVSAAAAPAAAAPGSW